MKATIMAAVAAILITTPVMAGGLSSPWDEPDITVIPCPAYGFLGFRWEWCPGQLTNIFSDYDDETLPVSSDYPDDEHKDKPKDKVKKDKKPKSDNSDANGKGGNRHDRTDKDNHSQEIAERKKGV